MTKTRVARIITRLNVGGPAYQAALLNHLLPQRGYETLLIHGQLSSGETSFDNLLKQFPGPSAFLPTLVRPISPKNDWTALSELTRILRDFKPDIVHTHTAKAGFLGRLAALRTKTNVIVHTYHGHVLEGYFNPLLTRAILMAERFLAKRTDRLITVSKKLANDLSSRFKIAPPEKFAAIELGLPLQRFADLPPRGALRSKLNIPDSAVVFGSLGRLVPIKNFHRMLQVFSRLTQQFPSRDLRLIIGGTGPLENDLKQTARQLNLQNRVVFLGLVDDLEHFYADLDLAILTSDNEGTPVTLLEAQAAGKFVIAPDVGGISDVLDPQMSLLIAPNTVDAYLHAIRPVLENLLKFTDNKRNLRSAVIDRFSPDRLLADIDQLYGNLLREKKHE